MKAFLNENFFLQSPTAEALYHSYAESQPVIDFHCHLPVNQIAQNINFENLTQAWLYGDHYKWRAMRANGVAEHYITGSASDYEKFEKWAGTVPYTVRNPLYHWTHLELRRYFNIQEILSPSTARDIYERASEMLRSPEFTTRALLKKIKVKTVCTTDDPADTLSEHTALSNQSGLQVFPTFRPDKAMNCDSPGVLNAYIQRLEQTCNRQAPDLDTYVELLKSRHQLFVWHGCRASDHGINEFYAAQPTHAEATTIYKAIRQNKHLNETDIATFKSFFLHQFALWDYEADLVQQFHFGAMRNTNTRQFNSLGPDTGHDSIGDDHQAAPLAKFLDTLDQQAKLTRTILYNLSAASNEIVATMAGNFNDGSTPGKIQFGAAWWFHDQKHGIINHLNMLSDTGLLSRFVGMTTDSRSFLSFPRHEYFRRILCNLIGNEVDEGELPDDLPWLGKMVANICYQNAKDFFRL